MRKERLAKDDKLHLGGGRWMVSLGDLRRHLCYEKYTEKARKITQPHRQLSDIERDFFW